MIFAICKQTRQTYMQTNRYADTLIAVAIFCTHPGGRVNILQNIKRHMPTLGFWSYLS